MFRVRTTQPAKPRTSWIIPTFVLLGLMGSQSALAQPPMPPQPNRLYFPLDQRTPPGVAGQWSGVVPGDRFGYMQPVRVVLPTEGKVTFFDAAQETPIVLPAPAQARIAVTRIYRIRIAEMPEFPGAELFPSIEMLDRLHPPADRVDEFPVPIEITAEEVEHALGGRLVTKVVYLEQPQYAEVGVSREIRNVVTIPNNHNLLADAHQYGRPMAIVRIGGRVPNPRGDNAAFFAGGGPVHVVPELEQP